MKAINKKHIVINSISLLVGSFLLALSIHVFTLPAKNAPGGIAGIASIIQIISGFPAGYSLALFNIPLIILSFIYLSKKFAIKSTIGILLSSLFLQLFDIINLFEYYDERQKILSALAGGIMSGIGVGILVRTGSSSGGTEIISLLVQKKHSSLTISWQVLAMNVLVITFGGIMYVTVNKMDLTEVIGILLCSLLQVFVSSKCIDIVLNGLSSAVKFEVITDKGDELCSAIINKMARDATVVESKGGYTHEEKNLLICVVTRRQVSQFKKLLKEVDPHAFAFAMDTREVLGNGFRKKQ